MRHDRRLRIFGQLQLVVRPLAHQPEQVRPKRLVDLVEHVSRGPARLGERRAHANGLAALSRKKECAHSSPVCSPQQVETGASITQAPGKLQQMISARRPSSRYLE